MKKTILLAIALCAAVTRVEAQNNNIPPELVKYPELVLINGQVITVDKAFTVAQAVAVRDGKILAVGLTEDIKRLAGPSTGSSTWPGAASFPGSSTAMATTRSPAAISTRTRR